MPAEFYDLTTLQNLNLSSNRLDGIPEQFSKLSNLRILDLSGCNLDTLPIAMSERNNLEELICTDNNIQVIPEWITKHRQLQILDLKNNRINTIPLNIRSLKKLRILSLKGNSNLRSIHKKENVLDFHPSEIPIQYEGLQTLLCDQTLDSVERHIQDLGLTWYCRPEQSTVTLVEQEQEYNHQLSVLLSFVQQQDELKTNLSEIILEQHTREDIQFQYKWINVIKDYETFLSPVEFQQLSLPVLPFSFADIQRFVEQSKPYKTKVQLQKYKNNYIVEPIRRIWGLLSP